MKMKDLEITKELKIDIETNQNQLKNAICNHQNFVLQLGAEPDNVDLQKLIQKAEQEIIAIGIAQKTILQRLRDQFKTHQKSLKNNIVKSSIEERRFNLSNALSRARKQNIVSRPTSISLSSEDSGGCGPSSSQNSPEPKTSYPLEPQDITQTEFLNIFSLVTHDVYKEMQSRRVERKRRSTANPQFLYGNKGWDTKKRRNNCYYGVVSPPNTRQAVKKKTSERTSPPPLVPVQQNGTNLGKSSTTTTTTTFASFPSIPNLPSGLTIERVSPGSSSPDGNKVCVTCRQPGGLAICENCTNGFHVGCHNRPLAQSPRQCPRCIVKEVRTIGALTVPSGMTVSYITSTEVTEKMDEKKELEKVNKSLTAELTQLQDRHSQLTISLRNQKSQQEELLMTQQSTEDKIKQILKFIRHMRDGSCPSGLAVTKKENEDEETKKNEDEEEEIKNGGVSVKIEQDDAEMEENNVIAEEEKENGNDGDDENSHQSAKS